MNHESIILLHGIFRTSRHMRKLANILGQAGYEVYNLDYPSTQFAMEPLLVQLEQQLPAIYDRSFKVHLVGYSMGGLLVRALLARYLPENLGRVVQLAPPNHGSEVADKLKPYKLYQLFYGPAGQQLGTDQSSIDHLFASINYELGVLAGNTSLDPISSHFIPGEDDGKVSVESTKLEGMKDHLVLSACHTFFPQYKIVVDQTIYFLQHGEFKRI